MVAIFDGETETKSAGIGRPGAPQLELQDCICGSEHVLLLRGELDMACSPTLDAALKRICTDQVQALVLDLSQLTFIDSTGLRAILLARELCESHGSELRLIPGPSQVQRLFEVTGLLDRLPFQSRTGQA